MFLDWFSRGKILTGKPHDLHGKITLVSGEDFPLNQSIETVFFDALLHDPDRQGSKLVTGALRHSAADGQ